MRSLLVVMLIVSPLAFAESPQQARWTVDVSAQVEDATRSESEWSRGRGTYQVHLSTLVHSDGIPNSINPKDPEYAQKALAMGMGVLCRQMAGDDEQAWAQCLKGYGVTNPELARIEEEPEEKFLLFIGEVGCPSELRVQIDEELKGEYADVGGMTPFTRTFRADWTPEDWYLQTICTQNDSVYDLQDKTVYTNGLTLPEVTGHYIYREANRPHGGQDQPNATHNALPAAAWEAANTLLRVAPARGSKTVNLPITETPAITRTSVYGGYQGSMTVKLSWHFEPL